MMTADELNALAGPLLDRIGWPEHFIFSDDSGRFWDRRADDPLPTEAAAALIRCHVEDWLDTGFRLSDSWNLAKDTTGWFVVERWYESDGENKQIHPTGPTKLHALIAAATAVLDTQGAKA